MADEKYQFEQNFSFTPLLTKTPSFLQDKAALELLMKWSMLGRISVQYYSFDQSFYPYNSHHFALMFFKDPQVLSNLRKMQAGAWVPLDSPVVCVDVEVVPCSRVSMDLLDPIYACRGILRPSGHVVLQEEESEHYDVIGREERGEFLFRLFKHVCLGGELCQYEDTIAPYAQVTKHIYKDLLSVQRDPQSGGISVVSTVLKVCVHDETGPHYPGRGDEEQTFAYLIIDPFKRHVCLLYHCYGVGSFTL
ncbi:hypothetical protein NHX12_023633 [Muraenolepis orangiensis]|uniref:Cilia- and flagella-associated protein 300 n=1 Tax=Muraenolepis orangiensis TaxID=630683 RepID=A0A9Q0ERB4_9TELE|nr:hypothetical protein NHX12_023633 [Muraenolepis orangiensis]